MGEYGSYEIPSHIRVYPTPIPDSAFVASGARVIGDVRLGTDSSIWYNAVVRGDINHIEVGARSNVQDGCIVHVTNAQPCVVGADVTVGHGVNLHACTCRDGCLIGMGAIILSGAHIGRGSVVGAGAVVREGALSSLLTWLSVCQLARSNATRIDVSNAL